MSQRSKKKVPAVRSGAPDSPIGEMPGVADSLSLESEGRRGGLNDRWTVLGVCIFLAAAIWVVFGQTMGYDFINYDDSDYVYENPEVARGLTFKGMAWAFTHVYAGNWHPLTWISHMVDCQLYGLSPGGHHLTNILLHTATAILLFLVLRRMTGFLWRSAFVAAVFAIHPLRVESVAWVAERKDVLSGVFFMLTIGAYVRYVQRQSRVEPSSLRFCLRIAPVFTELRRGKSPRQVAAPGSRGSSAPAVPALDPRRSTLDYGLVLLFFVLGLMCKPMLVTLPFVLLLLDYWPLKRFTQPRGRLVPWRLIVEKVPLLVFSGAACVATLFAQTVARLSIEEISLPLRMGNAVISYVAYIGQMFWPRDLAVLYPFTARGVGVAGVVLSLIVLAGISTGVFVLRRRPYLLTGWLWYLIMLVPVIGIVQVGSQARADRYTYLPQIGLYVLLTWAVADLCAGWRHRRMLLGGIAAIVIASLSVGSFLQTANWRDSESLWTHTLACTSDNFIGHNNLGLALVKKGNVDEAISHYQKALQITPDSAEAYNNLGLVLLQKGNVDEAISHHQRALQITPDSAEAHNNLGLALLKKGNVDEAISHYQKALQIKPDYAKAHNNLGNALLRKGSVDEAISHYQKALQIKPDFAEVHNNLGNALLQKGNVDEAISHYQRALQITPDSAEAQHNLGLALLQKGNVDEAISHYQRALQIKPDFAKANYNLGLALLKKGNVDEAIAQFQKALQVKPDYAEAQNNLAWVLATCPQASLRNGNKAVELAQRANQLTGDGNPVVLGTLAAAYAEAGRFPEAVATAQRALQVAEAQSNPALADAIRSQMKLYQAGTPFHLH
jgi:Flp pilus assembly protein TadD